MALSKKKEKTKVQKNEKEEGGESLGGKILLAFVTLLIIIIWLGIFVLLIKVDVGGFGSTVLRPIIKDVPYLNLILPEVDPDEDLAHQFESIDDAVDRIKELEALLDAALQKGELDAETITKLNEQIAALSVYKEEYEAFEKIKEEWSQKVVFGTEGVEIDYKWYKAFYEAFDPEHAEALYKEVVEQYLYDQKIEEYVKTYSSMPAKNAAAVFDEGITSGELKMSLIADILMNMDTQSRADILAKMDSKNAAKLTAVMNPEK